MTPGVELADHQDRIPVPRERMEQLEASGVRAAAAIVERHQRGEGSPLGGLEVVEVALVDDETSARVHQDFMSIPGETDVITFDHGEIVIGIEVAWRQAGEFGEPEWREVFRYLVHGLLHLAGHEDAEDADREVMETAQEALVAEFWE